MALMSLLSNKLRASLAMLGVVIGITFVLLMGWLLGGLDKVFEVTLSTFGEDVLYIDKWDWAGGDNWVELRNRKDITFEQYKKVKERLSNRGFELVMPSVASMNGRIKYDDIVATNVMIQSTTHQYPQTVGNKISDGRFFNEQENETGSRVCIIGNTVKENVFPKIDPINKDLKINGITYRIIGVMKKNGGFGPDFLDNQVIIPIKRFFSQFGNKRSVEIDVKIGSKDPQVIEDAKFEIRSIMRQVRSIEPGGKDDFTVNSQEQFKKQFDQLRLVVWGVGLFMTGLSFLVGSIGIMNIMFVSVTERTKEIGLRKALGATKKSILTQFIIESVFPMFLGAILGLILTSIVAYIASNKLDIEYLSSSLKPLQVAIAIIVGVLVGVIAGAVPAFRAARLDPIEALRAD